MTPKRAIFFGFKLLVSLWMAGILILFSACEENRAVKIGEPAPEILGQDIYGRSVSLSRLKGKIVVIYFWTNSCCGNSVKELEAFYRKNKDHGLAVLAINEMDAATQVQSYAKRNGVTFTMVSDEKYAIFRRYGGVGLPAIFIIGRDGIVREKVLGDIDIARLEELIRHQFDSRNEAEDAVAAARAMGRGGSAKTARNMAGLLLALR